MCFGVRDAIALAEQRAAEVPITILGELVHNETVLTGLREAGIRLETDLDRVRTQSVLITAHGMSDKSISRVRERGLDVHEATCPLVHHAHQSLKKLVSQGFHPVVIGQRNHVEVRGLIEDFAECDLVLSEDDIQSMASRPRLGVISQTTQPIVRVRQLVEVIRRRFPDSEVRFIDTVCQPTKQRQAAAAELGKASDVVVVIGGAHSNNTRELVATCRAFCVRVHHIQTVDDLDQSWFGPGDTVGVTAGTSTPDSVIEEVVRALERIAAREEVMAAAAR